MDSVNQKFLQDISELLINARKQAKTAVNLSMVYAYYEIGHRIYEEERQGKERAAYGKYLLKELSDHLSKKFGKGFSITNLKQMRISDIDERHFYEIEAAKNGWSLSEMKRQFDSSLYERLALSRNKDKVIRLASEGQTIENPEDAVKDPYVLEFLGLPELPEYSETELETKIIDHLQKFLLELGTGFAFIGRQVRFTFNEEHFRVDLVFYNRLLRCFVLFDLKIGELKHQDIGQMQMYVNYYDRKIKLVDENPTIGIVLCKDKNNAIVEMTLPENNTQIFASKYQTVLPSKEELKKLLQEQNNELD